VATALRQQGRREDPCGSNRNPYSTYFGFGPQFWCADFVAWCVDTSGDHDRRVAWGPPSAVRTITAWAERRALLVPEPERGDIFTYRNGAHCGFVTGRGGERFSTVEGNTTGRDGKTCWVAQHTRRVDETYYFVRWGEQRLREPKGAVRLVARAHEELDRLRAAFDSELAHDGGDVHADRGG
jgi:hypothetical protein